jgi:hypothetical protein
MAGDRPACAGRSGRDVEIVVWGLELYARYVVIVLTLGGSVALAVWLSSAVGSWSNRRPASTKGPSE